MAIETGECDTFMLRFIYCGEKMKKCPVCSHELHEPNYCDYCALYIKPISKEAPNGMEWISVKKALPMQDDFVKVKFCMLFSREKEALFFKNYFCYRGNNITKWVRYWKPID